MDNINIAIDGPAGAGKSTIAKSIAKSLNIIYLDTGAMYRAVAYKAINADVSLTNKEGLASLSDSINLDVTYEKGEQRIILDGIDISDSIRTPEISKAASMVAAVPEVRLKLVEIQRKIASRVNVVMDGRDIGTYVLPDAKVKIFLTASVEERAKRRYNEMLKKGINVSFTDILKDIQERDYNDSTRAFAPLKKAADAVEIDTTALTIEEVIERIIQIAGKGMGKC